MELILLTKALSSAAIGGFGLFSSQPELPVSRVEPPRLTKDELTMLFRAELNALRTN